VGIVSSTGGPQTLRRLLSVVAKAPIHPIAVVQHTAVGHTKPLASWLAGVSGLRIAVVDDGDRIEPGMIAIAPDDYHLEVRPGAIARLHHGPKVHSHRPSGTVLLRSLASSFGGHAAGVILTGMGDDGAAGAEALEKRGGLILIEEPDDAILEGMPRAAMNCTSEAIVAAPEEIGRMLLCPSGRGDE
ncbi:MAG: CheB methylesterase domain-containing protein, partial [Myxococcota bacterium]